ncbi:MAG: ATPase, partial [Runella slithyformis]
MIQRGLQERILDDLSFFPVVAIVGPRQVGKTTLARVIQKNMNVNCLYLD